MKLCFLLAMQSEAEPLLQALSATPKTAAWPNWLPFRLFHSAFAEHDIHLIISGEDKRFNVDNIGLEAASLMTYLALENLQPDLLISAGTCGGFATKGAQIGTVYLADTFLFHDRHVPLPGFADSSISHTNTYDVSTLAEALSLPITTVSSGSSLLKQDSDLAVMARFDVGAKEMEAAAIAWVCQLASQPMLALKSVTNLLDEQGSSEQQFVRHFSLAVQRLTHEALRLLEVLPKRN